MKDSYNKNDEHWKSRIEDYEFQLDAAAWDKMGAVLDNAAVNQIRGPIVWWKVVAAAAMFVGVAFVGIAQFSAYLDEKAKQVKVGELNELENNQEDCREIAAVVKEEESPQTNKAEVAAKKEISELPQINAVHTISKVVGRPPSLKRAQKNKAFSVAAEVLKENKNTIPPTTNIVSSTVKNKKVSGGYFEKRTVKKAPAKTTADALTKVPVYLSFAIKPNTPLVKRFKLFSSICLGVSTTAVGGFAPNVALEGHAGVKLTNRSLVSLGGGVAFSNLIEDALFSLSFPVGYQYKLAPKWTIRAAFIPSYFIGAIKEAAPMYNLADNSAKEFKRIALNTSLGAQYRLSEKIALGVEAQLGLSDRLADSNKFVLSDQQIQKNQYRAVTNTFKQHAVNARLQYTF